jgi:recombination protein RecR
MIRELARLPGIGRRSAERIALHLAASPVEDVERLGRTLVRGRRALLQCGVCGNLSAEDPCAICADFRRETSVLCVVEGPRDVSLVERSGLHRGRYHVLGGLLAPLDGVGREELRLDAFLLRLREEKIEEVVLLLSPSTEGDATAMLLQREITAAAPDVRLTRAARGIPAGGKLDYLDEVTLGNAFEGRREMP